MKKYGTLLQFLLLPFAAFCQITLSIGDLPQAGDRVIYGNQIFQGNTPPSGSNQNYTFTESDTTVPDTTYFVTASTTPFASSMAGSNLASVQNGVYTYYDLNNNGYFLRGVVFDVAGLPLSVPFAAAPFRFNPPLSLLSFPATQGMNLRTQGSARFEFDYDTVISLGIFQANITKVALVLTANDTSLINGFGNAEFVSGIYPVLRNEQSLKITTKIQVFVSNLFPAPNWIDLPLSLIPGGGIPPIYTKSLLFWANVKKQPVATFELDSLGNVENARYLKELLITTNQSLILSQSGPSIEFHPNPATESVTLSSESGLKSFQIFSSAGKIILNQSSVPAQKLLSVNGLPAGVYWAQGTAPDGTISRKRLIIK